MTENQTKQPTLFERRIELEKQIKENERSFSRIPNGSTQRIEAKQAKNRLTSFEHHYGPVEKMSETNKSLYEKLKQECVQKGNEAKEIEERYQKAKDNLDQMKRELEAMQIPTPDKQVTGSQIEILINESVGAWITKIEETKDRIDMFRNKRKELEVEKNKNNLVPKPLDEESLLKANVNKHQAVIIDQKKTEEKVLSIQDLIRQLDKVIQEKKTHLERLKSDFCSALREIIHHYTNIASVDISKQFKEILLADSDYFEAVTRLCNEMAEKHGVDPNAIFGQPGVNDLHMSAVQHRGILKAQMQLFIDHSTQPNS